MAGLELLCRDNHAHYPSSYTTVAAVLSQDLPAVFMARVDIKRSALSLLCSGGAETVIKLSDVSCARLQ